MQNHSSKQNNNKKYHNDNKNPRPSFKVSALLKKMFKVLWKDKNLNPESDQFNKTIEEIKTAALNMSEEEKFIFNNFLRFSSKTVSKFMVPRSDICAIALESSKDEIYKLILDNSHTRTLIYKDSLDNIVGFVHIKDLFKVLVTEEEFDINKLIRKHILAAPSMRLVDLLAEMQKKKTHIAVIIDEYGGTDGIVTIEDVLEGLVGKIEDEHDAEVNNIEDYRIINHKTIICNARVSVEVIEEALKLQLKKQDDYFETIGGLVLARAGYLPQSGVKIYIDDNLFVEILETSARSIKSLKLVIK